MGKKYIRTGISIFLKKDGLSETQHCGSLQVVIFFSFRKEVIFAQVGLSTPHKTNITRKSLSHTYCSEMEGPPPLHRAQQRESVGKSVKTLQTSVGLPLYQLVFVEALSTSSKAESTLTMTFPWAHPRIFILHSTHQAVKMSLLYHSRPAMKNKTEEGKMNRQPYVTTQGN